MAEKKIQARIRQKVDTKANWDKAINFVPLKGEVIIYSDLNQAKIGDGVTKVSALPFLKGKADASDKNPTLAWGTKSTVATVDGVDLHVTMPSNPNTHQSVTDKNPTLAWGTKSTVATIGSTDIHVTMPANPVPSNYVTTNTKQTITGEKTFNAPATASGEQATAIFKTANGGQIIFGKEGSNSGSMIALDQVAGTRRLNFRASATPGAIVWSQPESDSSLYYDVSNVYFRECSHVSFDSASTIMFNKFANASALGTDTYGKLKKVSLAAVATSGSYNDLSNKPTIPNTSDLVPYTGATKDVDLGKHSLSISNKSDGKGKITVSSQGISEDDVCCEITSTGVQLIDPGAGTGYNINYIDVNGFKVYLPNATYIPSGAEVFATKSNLSNLLNKGTSSTTVNQVVYNPVEMKKALTVPSIQTTPIQYGPTDYDSAVSLGYTTVNGKTVAQIQLACPGLGYTRITQDDNSFKIAANDTLSCDSGYGWRINESKILTESSLSTQQWKLTSTTGTVTTVNICIK